MTGFTVCQKENQFIYFVLSYIVLHCNTFLFILAPVVFPRQDLFSLSTFLVFVFLYLYK